jgi:hypothetical protein
MFAAPKRLNALLSIGLALLSIVAGISTQSVIAANEDPPVSPLAMPEIENMPTAASLHNPTFDNHDWYFFHERYDSSYPPGPGGTMKPILPDDDDNLSNNIPPNIIQDWRLWYMRNTPLIQTFVEDVIVREVESVAMRTYDGDVHYAGLYQPIYEATPCLTYQFQMYVMSKPNLGSPAATLRVGIDQVGWHPDSANDPAVPGAFPATTVWGPAQDFKYPNWGQVSVTAEAHSTSITVFTSAQTTGGRQHGIVWDSGSFQEVTPEKIVDPAQLPTPSGIFNLSAIPGRDAATVTWTTAGPAVSQVFYRITSGSVPPEYPNKLYLPMVIGSGTGVSAEWVASPLIKTANTGHSVTLSGLQPGRTYEYVAVSRGLSGSECTTWVSPVQSFTTSP